jgi:hypothetical protein
MSNHAASHVVHNESHALHAPTAPPTPPRQDFDAAELKRLLKSTSELQSRLVHHFVDMPLDRRVLYRDHLLQESLLPFQKDLRRLFLALLRCVLNSVQEREKAPPMTRAVLQSLKTNWLSLKGMPSTPPKDAMMRAAYFDEVRSFYAALLCSGLLAKEADVRLTLDELQSSDFLEPNAAFYESVFIALWTLSDAQRTTATKGEAASAPAADLVAGEERQLQRGFIGDLACHYMGHALTQTPALTTPPHVAVRRETWELFFCTFANAQPAPKLMDLWWSRCLEWVDSQLLNKKPAAETPPPVSAVNEEAVESSVNTTSPLPYQAVHAVLAWCAQSRDMERALKYFNAANNRGVTLHDNTSPYPSLALPLVEQLGHAGSLTAKSTNPAVQQLQLALLVKLMASTKSVKLDGGLRALVVRDVQRQIDPAVLYAAQWGVLNDLLSGLSVPSAMQLLRRCSLPTSATQKTTKEQCAIPVESDTNDVGTSERKGGQSREIPFFIWASLLRRCCREHHQDQAESLFLFLRQKFRLSATEKRELVEIMMRMYVTMQPSDFPCALDLFLQHVLRTPPNEPILQPDSVLYELLIRGADSRNASMMLFLEACGSGVPLTAELFEALTGSTQLKTVASLSRKLPHDYANSSLDAQLKIPADADAHLRREEALRARGKPLYDSTGDVG